MTKFCNSGDRLHFCCLNNLKKKKKKVGEGIREIIFFYSGYDVSDKLTCHRH